MEGGKEQIYGKYEIYSLPSYITAKNIEFEQLWPSWPNPATP